MNGNYTSTKVIELGSCAFRQPKAKSHCRFLHGYRLSAKFEFTTFTLDENNWVVDFGALNGLKRQLESLFYHTTIISTSDPELDTFTTLHQKGVIDLRVLPAVGIEAFAAKCAEIASKEIDIITSNRCWVSKVEVWEHEKNSATFTPLHYNTDASAATTAVTDRGLVVTSKPDGIIVLGTASKSESLSLSKPEVKPEASAMQSFINSAPLHNTKVSNSMRDPFKGTSWGNK
jgi:6-pyruvoyltetrahydropterin/6-carboxytetrahydropterin synthase